jgi:hypothetical protein
MKTEPSAAAAPAAPPTGEAMLAAYLAEELPRARKTLKRTRIICVILIVFVAAYIGTITAVMVNLFQPKAAAEIASGMMAQHARDEGPILAAQIEGEIPRLIHELPDYLIGELPVYRKELQRSLETEYEAYCNALGRDLGKKLDQLIDNHKSEIKILLENANDRDAIRKTLPDFDKVIAATLKNNPEGQALKERIDAWAASLKEVEKRMDRLANGTNLTPEEQKARRALSLLSKVIEAHTQIPAGTAPSPAKPRS